MKKKMVAKQKSVSIDNCRSIQKKNLISGQQLSETDLLAMSILRQTFNSQIDKIYNILTVR